MSLLPRPPHRHGTVRESGHCPDCRAYNIAGLADARDAWVVLFEDSSMSVVRSHSPDPATTAWATGCNPGGDHYDTLGPFPPHIVDRAAVPLFRNIAHPGSLAALDALHAAGLDGSP
jgi:hypothetical protein